MIGNGATLNIGTAWSESTTVSFQGGSLVGGNLTNLTGGNVQGFGEVRAALINQGSVTATNGNLRLNTFSGGGSYQTVTSGTLTFAGVGSLSSLANPNGTVSVEGTLTNNTVFNNAGTLELHGGTYQTTTIVTNNLGATIRGYGLINSAGALVNNGTLLATGGGVSQPLVLAQG